jgi:hypothetical protein
MPLLLLDQPKFKQYDAFELNHDSSYSDAFCLGWMLARFTDCDIFNTNAMLLFRNCTVKMAQNSPANREENDEIPQIESVSFEN